VLSRFSHGGLLIAGLPDYFVRCVRYYILKFSGIPYLHKAILGASHNLSLSYLLKAIKISALLNGSFDNRIDRVSK
jgi:hypothetical protein